MLLKIPQCFAERLAGEFLLQESGDVLPLQLFFFSWNISWTRSCSCLRLTPCCHRKFRFAAHRLCPRFTLADVSNNIPWKTNNITDIRVSIKSQVFTTFRITMIILPTQNTSSITMTKKHKLRRFCCSRAGLKLGDPST